MSEDLRTEPQISVKDIPKKIKLQLQSLPYELKEIEDLLNSESLKDSQIVDRIFLKEEEFAESIKCITNYCSAANSRLGELSIDSRENIRRSIDQFKYEIRHLRANLEILQRKKKKILLDIANEKAILMQEFPSNSTIHNRASQNTTVLLNTELMHNERLNNVNNRLDEMLEMAGLSLETLKDQHAMMKMAKSKVINLAQTLGVSNKVLKMIEKRSDQDMMIFCILAFLSIFFVIFMWNYMK